MINPKCFPRHFTHREACTLKPRGPLGDTGERTTYMVGQPCLPPTPNWTNSSRRQLTASRRLWDWKRALKVGDSGNPEGFPRQAIRTLFGKAPTPPPPFSASPLAFTGQISLLTRRLLGAATSSLSQRPALFSGWWWGLVDRAPDNWQDSRSAFIR